MDLILAFFNVNTTFFTVIGYPISYLEFVGTVFYLLSVWLISRRNMWTWVTGIISGVLFGILFYQIQLYADFFEQIYYFLAAIWGWALWQSRKVKKVDDKVVASTNSVRTNLLWVAGIAGVTVLLSFVLHNIHLWLPALFPQPASLVELDAATTIMSFAAMILLILRKLESWIIWIIVDVIAIGLYWYKEVPFLSLLYIVLLGIAINGLVDWYRSYKKSHKK